MSKTNNIQRYEQASQILKNGDYSGALQLLDENIKSDPSDIKSIYLSGICHATAKNYLAAEQSFKKAVKLKSGLFQVYSDLGLAQHYQNNYRDAIKSFNKALKINPKYAPALSHIALSYLHTNEAGKALKFATRSVAVNPSQPQYKNILALCHRSLNQIEKAINIFKQNNSDHPDYYDSFHNLYETYINIEDFPNAESILLKAKDLFKANTNIYITLGKLYENNNFSNEAKAIYTDGIRNCGENPDLLASLGRVNITLKNFDEGSKLITRALEVDKTNQPAMTELCNFYILKKDYEKAYSLAHDFIESNNNQPIMPGLSITYGNACKLNKNYEESINILNNVLSTPGIYSDTQSIALYSMGEAYDKMKDYDKAFETFTKANEVTKRQSDISYYVKILTDLKNQINRDYLDGVKHSNNQSTKPVFIVGMPRSGTSLVEQIISSHPDAYGAGEITELWNIGNEICNSKNLINYIAALPSLSSEDMTGYADRYLGYIEKLDPNARRITDKLPHNFMHIGLIEALFSNASIIHCKRHPFDTCLSIYFKKFNENHLYARNLSEIATFYLHYQSLMKHWNKTSNIKIYDMSYEKLVSNQKDVTEQIIQHIGLDWNDDCLTYYESDRAVMTPSYAQANKPIYKDSTHRWKHYSKHLEPLISILGDPEQYIE